MKFEKVFNNKKYIRKIEGMGEGLILFEISVVDKRIGQNYHLFYEDKRKPPLDIAINPAIWRISILMQKQRAYRS